MLNWLMPSFSQLCCSISVIIARRFVTILASDTLSTSASDFGITCACRSFSDTRSVTAAIPCKYAIIFLKE